MNSETEDLKLKYLEAVCKFLWYSGSPYSFHQGKASKVLADQQRVLMHKLFAEYVETKNG